MTTRIQMRRGTAAEWAAANPVLADGEAGYERDTGIFKVGDGVTAWNSLLSPQRSIYARKPLTTSATLDFPSIPANSTAQMTIPLPGALIGDAVALAPPDSLSSSIIAMGRVSAVDVVTIRLANVTAAAIDPVSAVWGVSIIR